MWIVLGFVKWWGIAAATAHETDGRSGSLLEHEIPTESTGRGADDEDASPTTNREALKTWARAGARSHTRHGSITGAVVSNGKNRSLRPSLLGKDIIDALLAAARTEIEEEVSAPNWSEWTVLQRIACDWQSQLWCWGSWMLNHCLQSSSRIKIGESCKIVLWNTCPLQMSCPSLVIS
jgi:hypothetical protein